MALCAQKKYRRKEIHLVSSLVLTIMISLFSSCTSKPDFIVPRGEPSEWTPCACCNWADQYPYTPDVKFRMWHDSRYFYIEYMVDEELTKAEQTVRGGYVHMDSAVECFLQPNPEADPYYYSIECNAAGYLYLACRTGREDAIDAPLDVNLSVKTEPSCGSEPFSTVALGHPWTLKVCIPTTALFRHHIESWDGFRCRMNIFKCNQGMEKKAFLSWSPVHTPKPSFHNPETFLDVEFEE